MVLLVQGRYISRQALDTNHTLSTVLSSINLLFDKGGGGFHGLLGSLLLDELVDGLFVISLGLTEAVDSAFQSIISGLTNILVFGCHRRLQTKEKFVKLIIDMVELHFALLGSTRTI